MDTTDGLRRLDDRFLRGQDVDKEAVRGRGAASTSDADGSRVVFAGGVNDTRLQDGCERVAQPETLQALDLFGRQSRAERWSVLVVGPAPVGEGEYSRRIAMLSEAMEKRCDELALPYVHVVSSLGDADWASEVAGFDSGHPSSSGYARLAGPSVRPSSRGGGASPANASNRSGR